MTACNETATILDDAIAFIESLTVVPLLMSDDIEMRLEDVQAHAKVEAASLRLRASRLTRQKDETRRAALDEATASARFARLMGIASRIIWTDLGEPAMQNAQTQVALQELSEFVLQDALEEAHRLRALSQKGDEADG